MESNAVLPVVYIAERQQNWPVTWNPRLLHAPRGRVGALWAVTQNRQIVRHDGTGWTVIPGAAVSVDAGADGSAFCIGIRRCGAANHLPVQRYDLERDAGGRLGRLTRWRWATRPTSGSARQARAIASPPLPGAVHRFDPQRQEADSRVTGSSGRTHRRQPRRYAVELRRQAVEGVSLYRGRFARPTRDSRPWQCVPGHRYRGFGSAYSSSRIRTALWGFTAMTLRTYSRPLRPATPTGVSSSRGLETCTSSTTRTPSKTRRRPRSGLSPSTARLAARSRGRHRSGRGLPRRRSSTRSTRWCMSASLRACRTTSARQVASSHWTRAT